MTARRLLSALGTLCFAVLTMVLLAVVLGLVIAPALVARLFGSLMVR